MNYITCAVLAAVLTGCVPGFLKSANRKNAPVFSAFIVCCISVLFTVIIMAINDSFQYLPRISNLKLLYLLLSGTLEGLFLLCLSTAVTHGAIGLAVPVINLRGILITFLSFFLLHERVSVGKLCFMIALLLGTVFLESRPERKSSLNWVLFSFLALFLSAGIYYVDHFLLPEGAENTDCAMFIRFLIASGILACVSVLGGGFKKVGKLKAVNWISMAAAGLSMGLVWLLNGVSEKTGNQLVVYIASCLYFPVAMLTARILHREKFPVGAIIGTVLVLAGMIGMQLFS
ncbi:MAG: EamA family transporter [Clostridia bacterium]|nr:EamA family transporter [Clostridia bacterium]